MIFLRVVREIGCSFLGGKRRIPRYPSRKSDRQAPPLPHRQDQGFTLMELMIVVAILSILAAIAIPKFGNMVVKAKESSARSSLGAIRSALSIYYSDNEGFFPQTGGLNSALTNGGKYLDAMPTCRIPTPANHPATSGVTDYAGAFTDAGDWMYFSARGEIAVNCTHEDSLGRVWSTH